MIVCLYVDDLLVTGSSEGEIEEFKKRSTRVSQLPSHLSDYEMFHDSTITSEGELVHFALIAQSKPVDFEKAMTNEKQMKAMQEEINLIERNQTWELVDLPQEKRLTKGKD